MGCTGRNGQGALVGRVGTLAAVLVACGSGRSSPDRGHGPIAPGIRAPLGSVLPTATAEQRKSFERGLALVQHRFTLAEGLGPAFNVTFCGACHERPTFGGGSGLYRNFLLSGRRFPDGAFVPGSSAGKSGGVIRLYDYAKGESARPPVPETTNVISQRNAIPFFGVGLIAELDDAEILKRADPADRDGDGISGRPNYEQGFVGRFGLKAQTVSIEGFIRGPFFNHLGITSDPLSQAQKAALPIDSSDGRRTALADPFWAALRGRAQAAAPSSPLADDDAAPDPELSTQQLFDVVSFAMLLAAPPVRSETGQTRPGRRIFDRLGCGKCHAPRLNGPRGPLPLYSDLLLHDMGEELADGIEQNEATGSEFRTQPLWGLAAVGPYLHDGRAQTIREAILMHGGEAEAARRGAQRLREADMGELLTFLRSLGGADAYSPGLLPPGEPPATAGEYGGPVAGLSAEQSRRFERGRRVFDREFGRSDGVGAPRFNGDSCRACHFEPAIGGAGPRGVNVIRHGIVGADGAFVPPAVGTVLHRQTRLLHGANRPQKAATIFEHRQTPPLFGLGLLDAVPRAEIEARADPEDADGDGISGRISRSDGGRLGRFGWKA